jgi:hypothetical protein
MNDLRTIAAEIARTVNTRDCPDDCSEHGTEDCERCEAERVLAVLRAYRKRLAGTAPKTDECNTPATHDPLDYLGYMIGTAAAGIIEAIGMISESAHGTAMLAQDGRCLDFKLGRLPAQYPLGDFQALIARQSLDHTSLAKLLSLPTEQVRP